jgi:hypothetical protein
MGTDGSFRGRKTATNQNDVHYEIKAVNFTKPVFLLAVM